MQPLPHQKACLGQLSKARNQGKKKALVVMATGLGKTATAAFDIKRFLARISKNSRVLYLCHQNDILRQARKTFEEIMGPDKTFGYFHGTERHIHRVDFLFGSFQSLADNRDKFSPTEFDYIVVDESHHGQAVTFRPTIEYFQPLFLLALTATPKRGDGQDIEELFGAPVFNLPLERAIASGLLCDIDYRLITDEFQNLGVLDTPAGKLSITELNRTLFVPKRDEEIAKIAREHMAGVDNPRVLGFCTTIRHATNMAQLFPQALEVHSRLHADEQRRRLKDFRNGSLPTIFTIDKFNEGIDVPEVNVVLFLRSTASPMIYLQQLGRGLRQAAGKTKLLVLDFVANCERIEMIDELRQKVAREREALDSDGFFKNDSRALTVHVANFEFNEVAKKVLEIVGFLRVNYSRELICQQLQELAEALGRPITQKDVRAASKSGKCASPPTIDAYFGSWTAALAAAGLESSSIRKWSEDELIRTLEGLGNELGRTPRASDVAERQRAGVFPGLKNFQACFGTWSEALRCAGFATETRNISREEVLSLLRGMARILGRSPKTSDRVAVNGLLLTPHAVVKHFGTWNAGLVAAGLQPTLQRGVDPEIILGQLRLLAEKLNRAPTVADWTLFSQENHLPSSQVILNQFKSWTNALSAAGIQLSRKPPRVFRDEEIIEFLRFVSAAHNGQPLTFSVVNEACKRKGCPGYNSVTKRFGGLNGALQAAGLPLIDDYRRRSKQRK